MGFDQIAARHSEEAWIAKYRAALADTPSEPRGRDWIRRLLASIYSVVAARLGETKKAKPKAPEESKIAAVQPAQTERVSRRQGLPPAPRRKPPAISGRTRTRVSGAAKKQ
jgi:hypothetical protein